MNESLSEIVHKHLYGKHWNKSNVNKYKENYYVNQISIVPTKTVTQVLKLRNSLDTEILEQT